MIDPAQNLQKAIHLALKSADIASGKIYHKVPPNTALPYLYIGDDLIEADYDGGPFSRCTVIVDVFAENALVAKALAGAVRATIETIELAIDGFITAEAYFAYSRFIKEPDGLTAHAVVAVEYLLIPTFE